MNTNDSYLVLIDGTRINFDMGNTPIENFTGDGEVRKYNLEKEWYNLTYTINGQYLPKNDITEVYFGESYNGVQMIGHNFLQGCENLTAVDLSGLRSVRHVGHFFLNCNEKLTEVNFSQLTNLKTTGGWFLAGSRKYTPAAPVMDWLDSLEYDGTWCLWKKF